MVNVRGLVGSWATYSAPFWIIATIVIAYRELVGFHTLSGPIRTVVVGFWDLLSRMFGWLPVFDNSTWIILLSLALILVALESTVQKYDRLAEEGDFTIDWDSNWYARVASAVTAGIVVLGAFFLWRNGVLSPGWDVVTGGLILGGFLTVGYVIYRVRQSKRKYAKTDTAIRRAGSTIQDDFERWSVAVFGSVVLAVSVAVGILTGASGALNDLGDPLMTIMPELAYVAMTSVGYVQLGGSFPGAWLIPDVTAAQWVGLALGLGILAIMLKNR